MDCAQTRARIRAPWAPSATIGTRPRPSSGASSSSRCRFDWAAQGKRLSEIEELENAPGFWSEPERSKRLIAEKKGFKVEEMELIEEPEGGIRGATIRVEGDYAFGWLKA